MKVVLQIVGIFTLLIIVIGAAETSSNIGFFAIIGLVVLLGGLDHV